jgi:hypothetical protein
VAAVFCGAFILGTAQSARAQAPAAPPAAQQPERKYKDSVEYDLINAVIKDLNPGNPDGQKALADLDTWKQKYPESDFKDNDRLAYYMQAYLAMKPPQPGKALEYAAQLLSKDLKATFPQPVMILQVLFRATLAGAGQLATGDATAEQLANTEKAARALKAFIPTYFAPELKPAGGSDAEWAAARKQLEDPADQTLLAVAYFPFNQALTKKDYKGAEDAYAKAAQAQDSALAAYKLGAAIVSDKDQQKDAEKVARAFFFIARAVVMDPAKGGLPDAATRTTYENYLNKNYKLFHGSDEGLDQLKQLALASPVPPAGFKILTSAEIDNAKEEQFKAKYPELSLWLSMKKMLATPEGDAYFASSMLERAIGGLKGVVVGGKPECNPKEILVAVPEPDQTSAPTAVITLKLEAAIKGKPVAGQEIKFGGGASAFTRDPFMLTLDVDKEATPELKTDPCTPPAAAKKAAPGPGTPKKPGATPPKKK